MVKNLLVAVVALQMVLACKPNAGDSDVKYTNASDGIGDEMYRLNLYRKNLKGHERKLAQWEEKRKEAEKKYVAAGCTKATLAPPTLTPKPGLSPIERQKENEEHERLMTAYKEKIAKEAAKCEEPYKNVAYWAELARRENVSIAFSLDKIAELESFLNNKGRKWNNWGGNPSLKERYEALKKEIDSNLKKSAALDKKVAANKTQLSKCSGLFKKAADESLSSSEQKSLENCTTLQADKFKLQKQGSDLQTKINGLLKQYNKLVGDDYDTGDSKTTSNSSSASTGELSGCMVFDGRTTLYADKGYPFGNNKRRLAVWVHGITGNKIKVTPKEGAANCVEGTVPTSARSGFKAPETDAERALCNAQC